MPTARARHVITETPPVADAIEAALERWPDLGVRRAEALRRVIAAGRDAIDADNVSRREDYLRAVDAAAGALTGTFPAGAARGLKDEWPE
jgi:hypothetical protein